jgi:predicted DsbA family dithiol-disulfide isomerase
MTLPTIEIYASLECPYAYLATYRLRQVWSAYAGRLHISWRALSLEYVNRVGISKNGHDAERVLFAHVEPALPWRAWSRPDSEWPVTAWPAFEALACAQAQHHDAAFAMSWALRHAFFMEGRSLALRHELFDIAKQVARAAPLDLARFEDDWDSGRYKRTVFEESRRGWHELKLNGSATFVLPDGQPLTNPAIGAVDFDEVNHILRSYVPYQDDPLTVYRDMLERAARTG